MAHVVSLHYKCVHLLYHKH